MSTLAAKHDELRTEARTGLNAWERRELPEPPTPAGIGWIGVVGPGVIVLGASIGSGEFLLGPTVFVRLGLSLLWVTMAAVFLQTIFNTELMRYTLATGEPAITGFMRTRPSSTTWAWVYAGLYLLQIGWPAWAGVASGAIFFLVKQRLPGPADAAVLYYIGIGTFLACVAILLVGRRIERTLELLNWVLVACILGGFFVLSVFLVPLGIWFGAIAGLAGFDLPEGRFNLLPTGSDFFLLASLAAYSGAGGMINITLSNWARDKGYGMAKHAGYIPAIVGGQKVNLAHAGFTFTPDAKAMARWRGWWRIVRVDQWGVFFMGALLGMLLPAILYVTFIPAGNDIRGLGISAVLAQGIGPVAGAMAAGIVALLGAWILFKAQLDVLEGMVRSITDIIWTGSRRSRTWCRNDVRLLYYAVLAATVIWGIAALRLAQPIVLLQLSANMAGFILIVAPLHLLYVNTHLLPEALRPPKWRQLTLVAMAMFYGFFTAMSVHSLF